MRPVEGEDKVLEVIEPPKKMEDYKLTSYVIPEYVTFGNDTYIVKYIGTKAFSRSDIETIVLSRNIA